MPSTQEVNIEAETEVSLVRAEQRCYNYRRINRILFTTKENKVLKDSVVFDHQRKRRIETIYLRPSEKDLQYHPRECLLQYTRDLIPVREGPLKRFRKQRDLDRHVGDIPCEHNIFWEIWENNPEKLENLWDIRLLKTPEKVKINYWPEDYEIVPKEDLYKVEKELSIPDAPKPQNFARYHEVGRVFFEKEISYRSVDSPRPPTLKL